MHADANPYTRYAEHPGALAWQPPRLILHVLVRVHDRICVVVHADQVIVTVPAGSAVFLNARIFHGNESTCLCYCWPTRLTELLSSWHRHDAKPRGV